MTRAGRAPGALRQGSYVDRYHHRPHSRLGYKTPYQVKETWEDLQNIAA